MDTILHTRLRRHAISGLDARCQVRELRPDCYRIRVQVSTACKSSGYADCWCNPWSGELDMLESAVPRAAVIARHLSGAVADPNKLNALLQTEWAAVLVNDRLEIAALISVNPDSLDPALPPVAAVVGASGTSGSEIVIHAVDAFSVAAAGGLGKLSVDAIRAVWTRYLLPPLRDPRTESIGSQILERHPPT